MQSRATTVQKYLAELPEDRREALQAVRMAILENLPKGYEEGMQYGMIGYFIPHSVYPPGYHIEPGAPWENGFAESFFSRLRDELLNCEEFINLAEARWFARRRIEEHNHERPHSSLGYQTPAQFADGCANSCFATLNPRSHSRQPQEPTLIAAGT